MFETILGVFLLITIGGPILAGIGALFGAWASCPKDTRTIEETRAYWKKLHEDCAESRKRIEAKRLKESE
jgi:hypothetical protein